MKKRYLVALILIALLIVLGGLYWLGYLQFQDSLPIFNPNPGSPSSDTSEEPKSSPQMIIDNVRGRINKISAEIRNIGDQDAESIQWSISVEGGILKRIDIRSTGTIPTLSKQSTTTVVSDRIPLGLGRLKITVTVEVSGNAPIIQTAQGFKFLFFVVGVRST
jgi:hypothetical protein